ncbi:hypothetical protein GCM10022197_10050 [Microlunatus spumicola]|uniref:DUF2505 domain-containing protein n=1 Tax=Microlunatus spumicola TaxID=81499 RepID=A0ABP6WUF9_9ACTN
MDISTDLDFAATPAAVHAMMLDRGYQEQVCVDSESRRWEVEITPPRTKTSRTLDAPESAARFTGSELTILEETTWGEAAADGSRRADLVLTVERQPVTLRGTLHLAPGGRGTTVRLTGELKVNVPLLGRKLEQGAAPAVLAGFRTQQKAGDRWLAENPAA